MTALITTFWEHFLEITLDMAPWLLVGLIAAGFVKALIPERFVMRWLGGRGIGPITRGALVGVPLPLCSCSVIPMAIGLRRNGAAKSSTISFLVATPETGVDSIALSWIMLGPFMTVARPICAIVSAIYSGVLTLVAEHYDAKSAARAQASVATNISGTPEKKQGSGCASGCCGSAKAAKVGAPPTRLGQAWEGIRYAMTNLWDDIAPWLLVSVLLAALVKVWLPEGDLQLFADHNVLSMLAVVAASVPVYVCATASTPIAAAMLFSGMTPGVVLAFLIAGPGTNIAPLALIKKEMGWRTMFAYVTGITSSAIILGLMTDWIVQDLNLISASNLEVVPTEEIPLWLSGGSTLLLILLSFRFLFVHLIAAANLRRKLFINVPQARTHTERPQDHD